MIITMLPLLFFTRVIGITVTVTVMLALPAAYMFHIHHSTDH
jgi:hypothetical protein